MTHARTAEWTESVRLDAKRLERIRTSRWLQAPIRVAVWHQPRLKPDTAAPRLVGRAAL